MNTKHQIIIDQLIAKPIAFCLNYLVRFFGKILNIDHRLDLPFKRIVICKFKGLGSIIQATPMIQSIRDTYPESEITFISIKSNATFLSKINLIDKIIIVDDSSIFKLFTSVFRAIFQMLKNRPEVYIDLEIYSNFSTLFTISTLAKNRIGFYLSSSTYRMGIYTHMMYYNTNVSIPEVYMQIARLMNPRAISTGLFPIYNSTKEVDLYNELIENSFIIINPNASDLRIERRWDGEKFRALTQEIILSYPNKKVVFIGSPSESEYVAKVLNSFSSPNLINLSGKTSVDQLIQMIYKAELLITNDTGPMHIAFACNTPTIALFGPCSPDQYGLSANAKIIYKKVYCSPCVHEFITPPCKGNNSCMKLISLEEVMHEVNEFYNNGAKFTDSRIHIRESINFNHNKKILGLVNR
jgi:ADP-heptose:LPS heptosyltransferase